MSKPILFVFLSLFLAIPAQSQELRSRILPNAGNWDLNDPLGTWPFVELGAGYSDYSRDLRTGGVPVNAKLLGSYYYDNRRFVSDLGLGLQNHSILQSGQGTDNVFTGLVDVGGRVRLPAGWQTGLAWNTFLGSNAYGSVNDTYTSFWGATLYREFPAQDHYLMRVGGRFLTDLDIKGRTVNVAMLELAMGFIPANR